MCIQETATHTMIQVPRASWESLAGTGSVGGAAGAQSSVPKTKVVKRTHSLDSGAAARLVAAAVAARAESAADRQAKQGPAKRGKNIFHKNRAELLFLCFHTECEAHM